MSGTPMRRPRPYLRVLVDALPSVRVGEAERDDDYYVRVLLERRALVASLGRRPDETRAEPWEERCSACSRDICDGHAGRRSILRAVWSVSNLLTGLLQLTPCSREILARLLSHRRLAPT
jgi:hypothetical protein